MIVATNPTPPISEFAKFMKNTDMLLNEWASKRTNYFSGRNGTPLEEDVFEAMKECSKNTEFENSIEHVAGAHFPDIVAHKFYGVEVKSTKKNEWKSIGSSILESTRINGVERIFLTFGKLGNPVEFLSRPYEECLSGIAVTHYPRYQIDMTLNQGETIFDKMDISYDKLRTMADPVPPVAKYYKKQLKQGESLWWASEDNIEQSVSPIVKLWTSIDSSSKVSYMVKGVAMFPEILGSSNTKYQNLGLWLVTNHGIVNTNIRDMFSAGGQRSVEINGKKYEFLPAIYGKIFDRKDEFIQEINNASAEELKEHWKVGNISPNRIKQWCEIVYGILPEYEKDKFKVFFGALLNLSVE